MSKHFSETDIINYSSRQLSPADLLKFDNHLAECDLCLEKVANSNQASPAAMLGNFFLEDLRDDHLSYEQMAMFVDEEADAVESEIVEVHQKKCRDCALQIAEMREIKNLPAFEEIKTIVPKERFSPRHLWNQWREYSLLKIAVPALASILFGIMIWAIWIAGNRPTTGEIAEIQPPTNIANQPVSTQAIPTSNNLTNESISGNFNSSVANNANSNPIQAKNQLVLNDGTNRLELDENGNINNFQSTPQYQAKIKAALITQTIEISPDLIKLKSSSGALMGGTQSGASFAVTNPVGKIIQSERPQFRWQELKDAESYTVGVYDENFNEVVSSESLQTTAWTSNLPLKRGQIYQWQVTATLKNGEQVKSPSRPAPNAKFKVLDTAKWNEIIRARKQHGNSHLLLGILYANAGLLDEAQSEFQQLLRQNPKSDVARKLLRKVQLKR